MKKYISLLLCFSAYSGFAQLRVQSSGLNIVSGTTLSIDSLVLIPSVNLGISNNTLSKTDTPVNGLAGGASIRQLHRFASPISYSGVVGTRYAASELNGNSETNLQVAYSSSSVKGSYVTSTGSTRASAGSYYVSNTLSSVTLGQITATNTSVVLPLRLVDFSVTTAGNCGVRLNWTAEGQEQLRFAAESSADGRNWQELQGLLLQSGPDYELNIGQQHSGATYYRLRLTEASGALHYSNTRLLINDCSGPGQLRLSPNPVKDQCRIQLATAGVSRIRIYSAGGQQVMSLISDAQGLAQPDLSALPAGLYLAECQGANGVQTMRFWKE